MKKILKAIPIAIFGLLISACGQPININGDQQGDGQQQSGDQATLSSIEVTTKPTKVSYKVGEVFDSTGMVITAKYSDNSTKVVTDYLISNVNTSAAGEVTVKVVYEGKEATFTITVTAQGSEEGQGGQQGGEGSGEGSGEGQQGGEGSGEGQGGEGSGEGSGEGQQGGEGYDEGQGGEQQQVTLSSISVTSMPTKVSYKVGESFESAGLVVTAKYSDNSTKAVTDYQLSGFSSSSAGEKTITVTYQGKTTTFKVTVVEDTKPTVSGVVDKLTNASTNVSGSRYADWTFTGTSGTKYKGTSAGTDGTIQLRSKNSDSGIYTTYSVGNVTNVTVVWNSKSENGRTLNVYGSNNPYTSVDSLYSGQAGKKLGTIVNGTSTTLNISEEYQYVAVRMESGAAYFDSISFTWGDPEPVDPTNISITSTLEIAQGKSKTLSVEYTPANANQNKDVKWESSNTAVATVSDGVVSVKADATIGATAVITASLVNFPTIKSTCTVTVTELTLDKMTLLFYICGSNLESDGASSKDGCATDDLQEILAVAGQPDSVNIAVETGGAKKWESTLGIKNTELGRWHVENKKLVKDGSVAKASMGEASTLQSFLEWGIQEYPAEKYGLFMWNHGGAMDGCCFDENFSDDSLTNSEVYEAVTKARSTCGLSEKLEFIAYDACLMAVQDVAEYNSHNFNYMLSSQESEWAGGYDYDAWLPALYNNPSISTVSLLTEIGSTFLAEQSSDHHEDQTQSVLDLSKMADYKTAWEDMATGLKGIVTSASKWTSFANKINTARKYGQYTDDYGNPDSEYEDYNDAYVYDIFDVKGALTALKGDSTYSSISDKIDAVLTELAKVVVWESHGTQMSGSNGLCLFCPISGYNLCESTSKYEANYGAKDTNFTVWREFVVQYGSWYN